MTIDSKRAFLKSLKDKERNNTVVKKSAKEKPTAAASVGVKTPV